MKDWHVDGSSEEEEENKGRRKDGTGAEVAKFDPGRYLELEREAERLVDLVEVMEDREEQILAEVNEGRTQTDLAQRRVR